MRDDTNAAQMDDRLRGTCEANLCAVAHYISTSVHCRYVETLEGRTQYRECMYKARRRGKGSSSRGEEEEEEKKKQQKRGSWLMGRKEQKGSGPERKMGALTMALIAVIGLLLGWAAVEVACKPCLDSGRAAIDRDLNPDHDPDDDLPGGRDSQAVEGPYTEAPKQPKEV